MDTKAYNIGYDQGWNDAIMEVFDKLQEAGVSDRVLNIVSQNLIEVPDIVSTAVENR